MNCLAHVGVVVIMPEMRCSKCKKMFPELDMTMMNGDVIFFIANGDGKYYAQLCEKCFQVGINS